jgi:hypothetical protein
MQRLLLIHSRCRRACSNGARSSISSNRQRRDGSHFPRQVGLANLVTYCARGADGVETDWIDLCQ